jgi:hypothetical protein
MPLYELTDSSITPLAPTSFAERGVAERAGIQRHLRDSINVIDGDLLIVAEEFGDWEDSRRRIDLLAVDRDANLVVLELKRTEDGGHLELQAIRYAAMISSMTFEQAAQAYGRYLRARGGSEDPQAALLEFLGWEEPDEDRFGQEVRIVLVSAEFSKEITTSVIWLNSHGLDIRCVRLKPYLLGERLVLDVEQIIPLQEAEAYQIHLREKAEKERDARRKRVEGDWTGDLYVNIDEGPDRAWEDCRRYGFVAAGGGPKYRDALHRLEVGSTFYAYQKGWGYVGRGEVLGSPVMAKDFVVESSGKRLFDMPLQQVGVKRNADDPEVCEWVVPVRWLRTLPLAEAKTYKGIFANQNVVCRLRDRKTLAFLADELSDASASG